jgi:hypothetical protein
LSPPTLDTRRLKGNRCGGIKVKTQSWREANRTCGACSTNSDETGVGDEKPIDHERILKVT